MFYQENSLKLCNMITNYIEPKENETMRRRSWAALEDLTKNYMHSLKIGKRQKR